MADTKDSASLSDKLWGFAEKVFEAVWNSDGSHDIWHWVVLSLIALVALGMVFTFLLKALGVVLEHLIKLAEAYKSSGLPMLLSQDNKARVRRRKQFCGVLDADLSYLAKAENWNDQYFTDLEAEVETEGGYYATAWHRVRRKKSIGLRKEKSLIRAITSSSERAMQLVGEPGSGKSVALRHLAKQFAEQGRKSNDKNAIVPLYVNLREMEISGAAAVTANDVREFVLDNIRRGDADTSAFVRENWEDYCNRGVWIFLFDSFDEIPAVLHAEAGSNVIRQYSQAIRHFLEGMGECKGILASREFKGPEALPWKKLRILPLSGAKQDELIRNSFLSARHMGLVRQHLAISDSSIGATPLFLTLLCRYIRDEQKAPNNDHDILLQHVERLARREPEYLKRRYKLSVEELVDGAERLAQLFAEDENLSLAPTLDQIIGHLPEDNIPGGSIERLISALVDCKIGRADVPNTAHGDRRFAFAHRRYQEALFVRYLSRHSEAIPAFSLLTEPRWREYAVTLLQTRDKSEIQNLLRVACEILEERTAQQMGLGSLDSSDRPYSFFFDWDNEVAVPLLTLLQEGLSRRLHDVPASLSMGVHNFLEPRWLRGDTLDRSAVIRLGGLLPHDVLIEYLDAAFASGTKDEREQAFKQAVFALMLPESSRASVLRMLSDEVLLAHDRADQLRVEALAARLPSNMGAGFVVSRCGRLRRKLKMLHKVGSVLGVDFPLRIMDRSAEFLLGGAVGLRAVDRKSSKALPSLSLLIMPLILMGLCLITFLAEQSREPSNGLLMLVGLVSICIASYVLVFGPFLVRSYGGKVNVADASRWVARNITFRRFAFVVILCGCLTIFVAGMWPLGFTVDWISRFCFEINLIGAESPTISQVMRVGFVSFMVGLYGFGILFALIIFYKGRARLRRWRDRLDTLKCTVSSEADILLSAKNVNELCHWLLNDDSLLSELRLVRGFSSFVLSNVRKVEGMESECLDGLPPCLSSKEWTGLKLLHLRQVLEDRFKAISSG
ncbi:NACHT domain-containing protein [Pseudomonas tussilaginis]|uniref:NACHT domain-containing protein n=1 Tax=Pseudomonas putida TaxID=303 RepID=UPI002363E438|nr:NACHT domain-containing protein [Pseudomonas putida]MDD1978515.1 NACHT domain-containing protein [Pseudomonas putida]